jgi:hypothetical protein
MLITKNLTFSVVFCVQIAYQQKPYATLTWNFLKFGFSLLTVTSRIGTSRASAPLTLDWVGLTHSNASGRVPFRAYARYFDNYTLIVFTRIVHIILVTLTSTANKCHAWAPEGCSRLINVTLIIFSLSHSEINMWVKRERQCPLLSIPHSITDITQF